MQHFGLFRKQIIFIILIFLCVTGKSFSQETPAVITQDADVAAVDVPASAENAALAEEVSPEGEVVELTAEEVAAAEALKVTEMDIRTSTLSELADWCRTLGLSEGGSRQELDRRLREHYGISAAADPIPLADGEEGAQKTIVIESARTTEYFTLEVVDEEYARLMGNVVISLKDGDTIHKIKAWEITYNRTRNTMTAKGGVEYQKEGPDSLETFKGDSLTINLDTFAGVFTGGASERSMPGEGTSDDETAYRFEGSVISRSGDEVTVLQDAVVSNAKNEENYWSINASKLWLLPGSDFAIFNAVLKVGEIPLFYIPFFFLPADEIVFHPVVGMRTREGSFFQTTTYILGRPKASETTEQSITSMLGGNSDMERTREGLFLRSTGRKSRDPNDTRLSILFDAYANLGAYIGTEFELPKIGVLDNLNLSLGIGFTRDIYDVPNLGYTPFAPNANGASNWNQSNLFSQEVPFRYRLKTSGKIAGEAGNISWNIPFYSDPFVEQDFMNRSEELDFMSILEGNNQAEEDLSDEIVSSYEMRLSGSSSPQFPVLNPYISRISISNISSFLTLKTRNAPNFAGSVSPQRTFFYPDKFTLLSINGSINGTPFSTGSTAASKTSAQTETGENDGTETAEEKISFQSFGVPRSPWDQILDEENTSKASASIDDLVPPVLNQTFTIPSPDSFPTLTVGYSLSPSGAIEMQYNSSQTNWEQAEDVNWDDVSSVLSLAKLNGKIDFTAKDPLNYYTLTIGVSGDSSWRDYYYINEESAEFDSQEEIDKTNETNYRSSYVTSSSELTATVRPFAQDAVWGNSNVKYTLKNLLAKTEFSGNAAAPEWKVVEASWDEEGIEAHKITTNIAATVWGKNQSFVLDTDIPPRQGAFTTTANLRFWFSETYINGKIRDPFEDEPIFDPYTFTETLRFNTEDFLRYSMVYNPQDDQITSISAGLGLKGFTTSFSMEYIVPYFFDNISASPGWKISSEEKELAPKDFSLGFDKTFSQKNLWNDRFSFSIDVATNIKFDLQRFTYSSLNFDLGVTLAIKDILDISFSTRSSNSVIYRYVQDIPFFALPIPLPGEKNVFIDLLDSFRFDNEALRKSSGFKLRELSLDVTHYMGDWNLNLEVNLVPYLDNSVRPFSYKFNPKVSFMVTWVPISAIKSEVSYDKDMFNIR
ncbi:MAG: LPS-assembly protein LptD [Treponema sp.]|jgi:hypothetical protein|nr:LPS-assembly protein LptD [Treponema sp.]